LKTVTGSGTNQKILLVPRHDEMPVQHFYLSEPYDDRLFDKVSEMYVTAHVLIQNRENGSATVHRHDFPTIMM